MLNHLGMKHNTATPLNVQQNRQTMKCLQMSLDRPQCFELKILLLLISSRLMKQCAMPKSQKQTFKNEKLDLLQRVERHNFNTLFCTFSLNFELIWLGKDCSNIEL